MKGKLFIVFFVLILQGCFTKKEKKEIHKSNTIIKSDGFNFSTSIKYAKGFVIKDFKDYKQLIVFDKWNKDTLTNCIIYPKGNSKPNKLPKHDFSLSVPISSIACLSSTHIGFVNLLNELDKVQGVGDGKHIYNSFLRKKYEEGKIVDLGVHMTNNIEGIIDLSPDLVLKTGFNNVKKNDVRINQAGINVSYNVEWMEGSMLARAEWLKYISCFFCKEQMADSIFNNIETRYLKVRKLALGVNEKPKVLSGQNFKGVWYMPGGQSYMSLLIQDAGGDYYYKRDSSVGSLRLSLEVVIDKQLDCDIWLGPRVNSLSELSAIDKRYDLFKAYKSSNIYTFNNRLSPSGGNDYWETGIANPDIILYDVIKIFHPSLVPNHKLFYYKKLS